VKLEDHLNVEQYLNEILLLTQKFAAIEAEREDEFIGVIMQNGLGDEYDPMIVANSGTKISSNYVRSMLIQQDTKHPT
jgi:hypothetical protein